MIKAKIHDWHRPSNDECAQNLDIDADCTCKRKRNRKNYRVVKVHDEEVPQGCKKDVVMEVYPNGRLVFREAGRRKSNSYATTVGAVYSRLVMNEALEKARAKKVEKQARKKLRKGVNHLKRLGIARG